MISRNRRIVLVLAGVWLLKATTAQAGATPIQKCQAAKNKSAGQYAACRLNAEAKFATSKDEPADALKRTEAFAKCETKFVSAWQKAIAKAAKANTTCLDAPLTEGAFRTVVNDTTENLATALAGLGLTDYAAELLACATDLATAQAVPKGQTLRTGQTTCYSTGGTVIGCAGSGQDGELQRGLTPAYVDNADGTITDTQTGLMWEKLSDDGSLHDKDTQYSWDNALAVKIAGLNAGGGFAGHADWRLPNVKELQSLVNYGVAAPKVAAPFNTACAAGCTVTTCSCTSFADFKGRYWSGTASLESPAFAYLVDFADGASFKDHKPSASLAVRGVRGGP